MPYCIDPGTIVLLDNSSLARCAPALIVTLRTVEQGHTTLVFTPVAVNADQIALARMLIELSALFDKRFVLRAVHPVRRLDEAMAMIVKLGDEMGIPSRGVNGTPGIASTPSLH
jgi:hypothetical protein